jgi:Domain of unknown function (DUF3291)
MPTSPRWHLAQFNIARMRAPLTDPQMNEFVAELEPVNALADQSPGFVWRLKSEEGDATAIRPYDDESILINLSVWESLAALRSFVYRTHHVEVMRKRENWFERMDEILIVLWWINAGNVPTVQEAKERLDYLRARGESPFAFSFKKRFLPPDDQE